jgi:hypothetical protein
MDFTRKISKAIGNPMHFLGKFIEEKEALNFEAHYLAPVFLHQVRAFMHIDLSTSSDNKASYHYSLFLITGT